MHPIITRPFATGLIATTAVCATVLLAGCGDRPADRHDSAMPARSSAAGAPVVASNDPARAGTPSAKPVVADNGQPVVSADVPAPRRVDDTGQNENDRKADTVTPLDQGNSAADIRVTTEIRRALVTDSALSTNAHNLKIITNDGVVVLRGPVDSRNEAEQVLAYAKRTDGARRVVDQIAVP